MDFAVDIYACREHLRQREEKAYLEREQRRQAAREAILAALQGILPHYPTLEQVYLFGSVTRIGAFQADSDIDLAVTGISAEEYFALWRDLEAALADWRIDLRELDQTSYFGQRVRQQGELIYEHQDASSKG
jgi:predicted nucleotidyltransferase